MNIHNTIKNQLQFSSKEKIVKQLGYSSIQKGLKTLDSFLESEDLYTWIHSGYYDFKYTAKQFLVKICSILDLSIDEVKKEIALQTSKHKDLKILNSSYIFVNTNFKRTSEPVFALVFLESSRRLKVETAQLESISLIVKEHYIKNNGQLNIWGKIQSYIFHHDNNTYTFDVNGKLIENNQEVLESKAILTLKGKEIL